MVRWLEPRELLDAGLRVVLSAIFGAYADKRELLAIQPSEHFSYSDEEELWIDYVSDLGDGFDATYAVASTLASESLDFSHDGEQYSTRRGRMLVMGGDQVYPSAKRREYEDRLLGPYEAALPCAPEGAEPHLFAIPGNHDWYDGLTNFVRIFCQDGFVGGWKTRQRRSYFAAQLPHGWWFWGVDIQFDTYIDKPQLDYFRAIGAEMKAGDRVILATGKPSWIKVAPDHPVPDSYRNLAYLEEKLIRDRGARVALTVSGDLHHYSRYASEAGAQKVTAGGGGAYMFPTHHLPAELGLPALHADAPKTEAWSRRAIYPSDRDSRRLRKGALRLPLDSPGLAATLSGVYALMALLVVEALRDNLPTVLDSMGGGPVDLLADAVSPGSAVISMVLLGLLMVFAAARSTAARVAMGGLHGLAHVGLAWLTTLGCAALLDRIAPDLPQFPAVLLIVGAVALVGYWLGALLFAGYLIAADYFAGDVSANANNVYACQSLTEYKNFLRLRLSPDGELTVFPIGLDSVPRDWRLEPAGDADDPWFVAPDGELRARLIEAPVTVR